MAAAAQIESIGTGDSEFLFHFSAPPASSGPEQDQCPPTQHFPLWLTLAEARQLISLCVASSCAASADALGGDEEQLFDKLSAFWHTVTR